VVAADAPRSTSRAPAVNPAWRYGRGASSEQERRPRSFIASDLGGSSHRLRPPGFRFSCRVQRLSVSSRGCTAIRSAAARSTAEICRVQVVVGAYEPAPITRPDQLGTSKHALRSETYGPTHVANGESARRPDNSGSWSAETDHGRQPVREVVRPPFRLGAVQCTKQRTRGVQFEVSLHTQGGRRALG